MRICIIGMGLIGGSIGMAVKRYRKSWKVVAVVRRSSAKKKCKSLKAADVVTTSLKDGIKGADLIILAIHPEAIIKTYIPRLSKILKPGQIVTDAASIKTEVMLAYRKHFGLKVSYLGSHPIAGSEKSGIEHAKSEIFQKTHCILTKDEWVSNRTIKVVRSFWKVIGSKSIILKAKEHDEIFACVSHLPHLVSTALLSSISKGVKGKKGLKYAGSGWADMTRLAHSSPELWRQISFLNKKAIQQALRNYIQILKKYDQALTWNNSKFISRQFTFPK